MMILTPCRDRKGDLSIMAASRVAQSIVDNFPDPKCANCKKTAADLPSGTFLKCCAKCKTSSYCSRDCQKADWKNHKKNCGTRTNESTTGSTRIGPFDVHAVTPSMRDTFSSLANDTFLHSFPEDQAFNLLVDSYRMRLEDECNFRGKFRGVYDGEEPLPDFQRFLDLAESKAGVLPPWWSREKRYDCEKAAMDRGRWSNLHSKIEKSDIQEHYGDGMMPMKIRMLAETIYGSNVMHG